MTYEELSVAVARAATEFQRVLRDEIMAFHGGKAEDFEFRHELNGRISVMVDGDTMFSYRPPTIEQGVFNDSFTISLELYL